MRPDVVKICIRLVMYVLTDFDIADKLFNLIVATVLVRCRLAHFGKGNPELPLKLVLICVVLANKNQRACLPAESLNYVQYYGMNSF